MSVPVSQIHGSKLNHLIFQIGCYAVLFLFLLFFGFPFYMMAVLASHTAPVDWSQSNPFLFGAHFIDNALALFHDLIFVRAILNSIVIAVLTTLVQIIFCTIAGYLFAKCEFKFKKLLFALIVGSLMIPVFLKIVPLYQMMVFLRWTNTYLPFVVPAIATPFGIFLMKQLIETSLPNALLEAGKMDGLNPYQIIFSIVFPVQKASIAVLATISFIMTWNDYLYAFIMLPNRESFTIPIVIQSMFNTLGGSSYGQLMIANVVTHLPILLVFLFASKQIIRNILAGSIKG
ncbi:MAG: carbohydrate ABC transporter permease [Spirochaetales bacterium]|nr:carbohydrate ABC transporter permease [Spirochaetales bacterium]